MVVFFFIELNNLNLICFENHKKPEVDFPNWLKKLLRMVGSWKEALFYNRKNLSDIGDLPDEIHEKKFVDLFYI